MSPFDLAGLRAKIDSMNKQSEQSDFWDAPDKAQSLLKKKKTLESTVNEYDRLSSGFEDISEMVEIAEELEDEDEAMAVVESFDELCKDAETFRLKLLLDGKYDHNSAILSIHAGTGGVDAMDWAQMLMRMYTRWADKHGYAVKIVDLQDDAEAGIKSCTMIIDGENAYGYLRRENGVHRLVRIHRLTRQERGRHPSRQLKLCRSWTRILTLKSILRI